MRYLIFWTIALSLLFIHYSHASDYAFKYGMGLVDKSPTGSIKTFSFREEDGFFSMIHSALEGGIWVDNVGGGRRSSAYAKAQMGVKPGAKEGLYAKGFWGACLLSSPDNQLGGRFQFCQDVGLGLRDSQSFIEAGYSHVSSAGLESPNKGRDFVTLSIGVRL